MRSTGDGHVPADSSQVRWERSMKAAGFAEVAEVSPLNPPLLIKAKEQSSPANAGSARTRFWS